MHLVPFHCNHTHTHLCPVLSPFHVFVLLSYCAHTNTFALTLVLLASPQGGRVCVTLGLTGILSDCFFCFLPHYGRGHTPATAAVAHEDRQWQAPKRTCRGGPGRQTPSVGAVAGHCSDSPWASAQLGCHFERITDSPWAPPCTAWMSLHLPFLSLFLLGRVLLNLLNLV